MNTVTTVLLSSRIVYVVLFPLLREISALLFALSIAKDCKARRNGSAALWGVFTVIVPVFSGIVYYVYTRILEKREPVTEEDNKNIKASKRLLIWAICIFAAALAVALVAVITIAAAGIVSLDTL